MTADGGNQGCQLEVPLKRINTVCEMFEGDNPANLPILPPGAVCDGVSIKTAKALDLTFPLSGIIPWLQRCARSEAGLPPKIGRAPSPA